jgi:hypothetical protein
LAVFWVQGTETFLTSDLFKKKVCRESPITQLYPTSYLHLTSWKVQSSRTQQYPILEPWFLGEENVAIICYSGVTLPG